MIQRVCACTFVLVKNEERQLKTERPVQQSDLQAWVRGLPPLVSPTEGLWQELHPHLTAELRVACHSSTGSSPRRGHSPGGWPQDIGLAALVWPAQLLGSCSSHTADTVTLGRHTGLGLGPWKVPPES